jgi:hypothetical protein
MYSFFLDDINQNYNKIQKLNKKKITKPKQTN